MRNWAVIFLALGCAFAACSGGSSAFGGRKTGAVASQPQATLESLSPAGQQELRSIVSSGRLSDLQWPNFSNYSAFVKEFYDESGDRLGWIQGGRPTPQALEMIGYLEAADQKGLDSKDYDGPRWADRVKALGAGEAAPESDLVRFDVALTVSAIRFGSDLHLGKVNPKTLHKDFDIEREKHDPGAYLWKNVVRAKSVKEATAGIEPPFPGYKRSLAALQRYLEMEKNEVPDPLPQVQKPVAPGQDYEAVGKLVRRLQFLGDLPASVSVPEDSHTYSGEVAEGVKQFQIRHGLEAKGKLGPQTITELNRPMSYRVEQLRLALERWRWVPHEFSEPPIVVNIPEFVLRAYNSLYEPALTMAVVVGRAMHGQTPVLFEEMKYVIFWPYWNVPPSILKNETVPHIMKDPAYLQKNNFEVTTYSGEVVTDGAVSEEVLAQLRAGKLMVRQKPGPKNALGLIKFVFPNNENIYLHSTPAPALFGEARRDFSHGCIRVEDPKSLAEWVLRDNPGWTRERIQEAFQSQKQQQVNLTRAIPVLIVYGTAVAKEDGRVYFFDDIYGHDAALRNLLAQAYSKQN